MIKPGCSCVFSTEQFIGAATGTGMQDIYMMLLLKAIDDF